MLWLKALHVIAMVCWFAGLFYLPRLFVYHVDCTTDAERARFEIMERRLYRAIMTPAAWVTVLAGLGLLLGYAWDLYSRAGWLHAKLTLVALLVVYHWLCGRHWIALRDGRNTRSARYFRVFNELPTLILVAVVGLTIVKPF
ncbi:MAG: protoporphyrinogen oxidase HemJ [Immundisolibacter sp.]|uniref:protoporphyrinogen oxidase HemJ n=1 Tax=Immundisolibacter sp. TaxID=1934948 RepID=UPI003D0C1062